MPLAMTFAALKEGGYDGWLTIEAFGRALPALAAATRVWRDFFPAREEVYRHGYIVIPRRAGRQAASTIRSSLEHEDDQGAGNLPGAVRGRPPRRSTRWTQLRLGGGAGVMKAGVQFQTWDARLFDLKKAAESKTYCDETKGIVDEARARDHRAQHASARSRSRDANSTRRPGGSRGRSAPISAGGRRSATAAGWRTHCGARSGAVALPSRHPPTSTTRSCGPCRPEGRYRGGRI